MVLLGIMKSDSVILCGHSASYLISMQPIRLKSEQDDHGCASALNCHCVPLKTTEKGYEWLRHRATALVPAVNSVPLI
jgi:hypothetical protein